jgi:hypothetical protein
VTTRNEKTAQVDPGDAALHRGQDLARFKLLRSVTYQPE